MKKIELLILITLFLSVTSVLAGPNCGSHHKKEETKKETVEPAKTTKTECGSEKKKSECGSKSHEGHKHNEEKKHSKCSSSGEHKEHNHKKAHNHSKNCSH